MYIGVWGGARVEGATTLVPLDVCGDEDVTDVEGGGGAVPIVAVVFGGGGGGGAVPMVVVVFGGGGGGGAGPSVVVCFGGGGGGGGMAVLLQPPLQLVTTMVEVVKVV